MSDEKVQAETTDAGPLRLRGAASGAVEYAQITVSGVGGGKPVILLASGGEVIGSMDPDTFRARAEAAAAKQSMPLRLVANEAIQGLLRSRSLMGLELDHAWGNIDAAEFRARATELLRKGEQEPEMLRTKIVRLFDIVSDGLDTETLATMFSVSPEQIEAALALPAPPESAATTLLVK